MRFGRNIGSVALDVAGIETVQAHALGGVDVITVNDLSGTGVLGVDLELSVTAGSGLGDGQADTVIVNATDGADSLAINGEPGIVGVAGLSVPVAIFGSDPTNDRLIVNALDGDDVVQASNLPAGIMG